MRLWDTNEQSISDEKKKSLTISKIIIFISTDVSNEKIYLNNQVDSQLDKYLKGLRWKFDTFVYSK